MGKHKSPIWGPSREEFQELVNNSSSIVDILRKLGLQTKTGGGHRTVKCRIEEENIDTSLMISKRKKLQSQNGKSKQPDLEDVMIEHSTYSRSNLKRRLLKENILENKCDICGFEGDWQGKPVTMILDHINGVNNDHRLENLRMVCPMCNSQLDTHAGRNNKKEKVKNTCMDCEVPIREESKRCQPCNNRFLRKK